ncbi:putative mitochondrial ATP synthase delta subunit [Plasmodium gaboni]|uniref:Putative mitochondrial ATP synthase delta subunit n=1 Tax=Plasmodium gaboni TaxID=647221 RepID=A0A151LD90_9APIC|nr:putative mitochondrial ATP synthase delta subunit [Plasmodium gaboni]KYN96901.1 putative mitochondrial ATP synthase delta subunit [Plasmodium gaboni]SOV24153.1 mitochondrial ATP synthase delta subunit, putative [Plasmodium sp. DRC-Itaito]
MRYAGRGSYLNSFMRINKAMNKICFKKNKYSSLNIFERNEIKKFQMNIIDRKYVHSIEEEKKTEESEDYYKSMGDNIEKRYSLALYNVAKKQNKINEVSNDLLFIKNHLLKDTTFLNFLHTPNIEKKQKIDFIKNECKTLNKFNTITENFMESLFDSKRISFLSKIIEEFEFLLLKDRKEIKCVVYTANEIDNNYKQKIQDSILFKLNKQLNPLIEYKIDPYILGGLILQIGNQVYDFSAKSKIDKIKRNFTQ